MKVELENVKPMDIEKRSFEIITQRISVSLRMQLRKQLLLSKTVPAL